MSYEAEMLKKMAMPTKTEVEEALLKVLFTHNGTIKEFAVGEEIVNELAELFSLTEKQRGVVLERIYRRENRIVKSPLWHRLLYRAADSLAKEKLISRPTTTFQLTNKKEWMLTESGYDKALRILNIPTDRKDLLSIKSYEVQKWVKKIKDTPSPENYNPFLTAKRKKTITRHLSIRSRGFRQAVIESYDCRCSVCGLKIISPDNLFWEVEAAHIVPHSANGKDDIWNGIALCGLHHWAFDVGWFTISNDYKIIVSSKYGSLTDDYGKIKGFDFINGSISQNNSIFLPRMHSSFPHLSAIEWHRENIFHK